LDFQKSFCNSRIASSVARIPFDTAWDTIKKSGSPLAADDQAASTRELLAKRIIAMGKKGERNPQRIVGDALAHLADSK